MTKKNQPNLAILAGSGDLPWQIYDHCQDQYGRILMITFKSVDYKRPLKDIDHIPSRLGAVQHILDEMHRANISDVVMAGAIKRPSFRELLPDTTALKLLIKHGLLKKGDDQLLRGIIDHLEAQNFRVLDPSALIEQPMREAGIVTKHKPNQDHWQDIRRGIDVLVITSQADIGQSVVIQSGLVLAIEAIEGTDEMIKRCKMLQRQGHDSLCVKLPKINQELRADRPTIGVETIKNLHQSGLAGLAVAANKTLFIDYDKILKTCNDLGIFLVLLSDEEMEF